MTLETQLLLLWIYVICNFYSKLYNTPMKLKIYCPKKNTEVWGHQYKLIQASGKIWSLLDMNKLWKDTQGQKLSPLYSIRLVSVFIMPHLPLNQAKPEVVYFNKTLFIYEYPTDTTPNV